MNLKVQVKCDTLVRQRHDAFAELRRDVVATVLRTAQVWEPEFADPTDLHGQLHCTSVRGLLLKRRIGRQEAAGEKATPGLKTRCGRGMSVVLEDGHGTKIRVRKAPSEVITERERLVVYPPAEQREMAAEVRNTAEGGVVEQLSFGGEFDALERIPTGYDWFVLWTLSKDALQVPEVFLAAVIGIDDPSNVVVLASTPLPRSAARQQGGERKDADFEDFRGDTEEGSGPDPA